MRISNSHERIIAATPERIAATVADFDGIWPTQIAPTPRPQGRCLYDAGLMLWEEFDRPGARAFRVIRPEGLQAKHLGSMTRSGRNGSSRFTTVYLRLSSTTLRRQWHLRTDGRSVSIEIEGQPDEIPTGQSWLINRCGSSGRALRQRVSGRRRGGGRRSAGRRR
jgi:hypothetical protein